MLLLAGRLNLRKKLQKAQFFSQIDIYHNILINKKLNLLLFESSYES